MSNRLRGKRGPMLVAGVLFGAPIAFFLMAWAFLSHREAALDEMWRQVFAAPSVEERFFATETNEVARELERLAAILGLHLAPLAPSVTPTPEATESWQNGTSSLSQYARQQSLRMDGEIPSPPPELLNYLATIRPTIAEIIDRLLSSDLPTWEHDVGGDVAILTPNPLGLMHLQGLLLLAASEAVRSGDSKGALEALEATWILHEATFTMPSTLPKISGLPAFRALQPIVRALCPTSELWRERLADIDLRSSVYQAMYFEAWVYHHLAHHPSSTSTQKAGLGRVKERMISHEDAVRYTRDIEELARVDVRFLNPRSFAEARRARTLRGQLLMSESSYELWSRVHRAELLAELTSLVIEERLRRSEGEPKAQPQTRPSRMDGLLWTYEPTPDGLRIELDSDLMYRGKNFQQLRFLLRDSAVESCS